MKFEDLWEVVEIEELSGISRWGYEGYEKELRHPRRSIMLVARPASVAWAGRAVLGFLSSRVVSDEWHINNVATHPTYRRKGIAWSLMTEGMRQAKERGATVGLLEVRASNIPAQILYQKLGFYFVRRRKGYYHEPFEDALVMQCDLIPDRAK